MCRLGKCLNQEIGVTVTLIIKFTMDSAIIEALALV